ncbi:hypothetical protein [Streptomyces sp. NBC_00503]|uniref:hypothetical protein n=1 Tax=Streptomyces sp. NBC_00503 TaxID=2903659 RepID=UPI002E816459|nr:hypothetical protein [Streptomyces sp. NBC_00503]WUD85395.1 hypothetical protein OG490_35225 [Streptomyces sp. NBC_00503]
MPKTRLSNDTTKTLGIWVEPWGGDYWMKPEEAFTVVTDTPKGADRDEAPFEVVFHDQGANVWVNTGYEATVYDRSGNEVDCGHQRPIEVLRAWTEASEVAADRSGLTPELQEEARSKAETMRWQLSRAEAAEREARDG